MLSDVASALQVQARQLTARLEEFRDGLLTMMGLLGQDREEAMALSAHALVNLDGVILKFSGDGDKREGIEGEVRVIVNDLAQPTLPGTVTEAVRESLDGMAEAAGEGGSVTLSGGGRSTTIKGQASRKAKEADSDGEA